MSIMMEPKGTREGSSLLAGSGWGSRLSSLARRGHGQSSPRSVPERAGCSVCRDERATVHLKA